MSIEHTARHAADAGYRAIVPSDGTSTTSDEWQNVALNYAMQNVAMVAHLRRDRRSARRHGQRLTARCEGRPVVWRAAFAQEPKIAADVRDRRPAAPRARVRLRRDVPRRESRHRRDDRRGAAHGSSRDTARARACGGRAARLAFDAREGPRADPPALGRPDAGERRRARAPAHDGAGQAARGVAHRDRIRRVVLSSGSARKASASTATRSRPTPPTAASS